MIIRAATPADIPAMVQLLKVSLGDSLIPKSEVLWHWKHIDNPFGESFVLLAVDDGELVGLRAFLQWQWINEKRIYKAIRAVDTATHPQHQGKGLFKKLTLQLLERCKEEGIDFVFNTPNEKSRPGYLKMGWVDQGPMPIRIKPVRILPALLRKLKKTAATAESWLPPCDWKLIDGFSNLKYPSTRSLQTAVSTAYIYWRYGTNPLFPYSYITDNHTYLLVYRIKPQGPLRELRIADIFSLDDKPDFNHLKRLLAGTSKAEKADIISISAPRYQQWEKGLGTLYIKNRGPLITLKQVAISQEEFNALKDASAWNYSLGDMELF